MVTRLSFWKKVGECIPNMSIRQEETGQMKFA